LTRIKICGMTNHADAECAASHGADAIGFMFAPSPRRVTPPAARAILAEVGPFVIGVGVFVNAGLVAVRETLEATGCSVAQLHGDEGPDFVRGLAPYASVKVLRVRDKLSIETVVPYQSARAIQLDTYVPGIAGGTGERFDPRLAGELVQRGWRVIVAGGLTPDNVHDLVTTVRPYGVDVSTGVEAAPGCKDHHKIQDFIAAVRAADREQQ
jgi:phosphoribosylanthranilate isomerase